MSVTSRRLRPYAAVALAAGLVLGAAACSNEPEEPAAGEPVTVSVQYFGSPGIAEALAKYSNPNIKVDVQNMGQLRDFQPKLTQALATGSGAGDIVMLEEGTLQEFLADSSKFANLLDLGASSLKDTFLAYKWEGGFTADKKKLVGLGTDIGGLALCYRKDLFAKAGLPTARDEVTKLWATGGWDDYVKVGKQFKGKVPNVSWIDSATSIMQPFIMQKSDTWFYSKDNKLVIDSNPIVKQAYDFGLQMAADGLTGKLGRWSPDWDAAFKNAAFATVPCPAWMSGVISERAGDAGKGQWDIAEIPGKSGNWGGSYLAIPEQSKNKKQAFEVLKYLTGKDGSLAAYEAKGAMPSSVPALDDARFKDSKNAYFSDAPTGAIFGASVKSLKPIHLGPKHQQLWETVLEPQMQAAEQGKTSAAAGWTKAVEEAKKLAG